MIWRTPRFDVKDEKETFFPFCLFLSYCQIFLQTDRETIVIGASVMQQQLQKLRTMPEEPDTHVSGC